MRSESITYLLTYCPMDNEYQNEQSSSNTPTNTGQETPRRASVSRTRLSTDESLSSMLNT